MSLVFLVITQEVPTRGQRHLPPLPKALYSSAIKYSTASWRKAETETSTTHQEQEGFQGVLGRE